MGVTFRIETVLNVRRQQAHIFKLPVNNLAFQSQGQFFDAGNLDFSGFLQGKLQIFGFITVPAGSAAAVAQDLRVAAVQRDVDGEFSGFIQKCFGVAAFPDIGHENGPGVDERVIVSSIKHDYTPDELVGKKIIVIANLQPTRITGVNSNGMLLAATNNACGCKVIFVDDMVPEGTQIH